MLMHIHRPLPPLLVVKLHPCFLSENFFPPLFLWTFTFFLFRCFCCCRSGAADPADAATAAEATSVTAAAAEATSVTAAAAEADLQYFQGAGIQTRDSATADRCATDELHSPLMWYCTTFTHPASQPPPLPAVNLIPPSR